MSLTNIPCEQPGCAGTIDDGYCDTCGMAAVKTKAAPRSDASDFTGNLTQVNNPLSQHLNLNMPSEANNCTIVLVGS